ncbi:outer membrane beta-barrel protein [Caldovatus sp. SYSU G05006]|uniref:Outer membrane beta-barrel protein n=2 Tax=Caldovatus aquaticus TaxID=2865671 RepID=A0ABS7EXI6_9PROT|nr:outer membrane beta-barrel protein [Caldovatus aquaticus]
MWKTIGAVAAAGMLALAAGATPAAAQEAVRGKRAGDLVLGLGVIGVLPESGGSVAAIGGTPEASDSATAQLDLTYFLTPNIALNLIAATTRHDVEVRNSAVGTVDLGHVWVLPPTLTLQYHPLPRSRVSPYLGLGVNYTVFYGEGGGRHPAVTGVDIRNGWALALNAGLDVEIAPNWLFNLDVKRLQFLEPDVRVNTVVGRIDANAELNPWVIGAGVRYRF